MYGLKPHTIQAIQSVFAKQPAIEKAILYGSRAKGNYRNASDIDISLVGENLTLSQQFAIETGLDNLLLPYKMDISIFHKIENQELTDHINRVGITFYESNRRLEKTEVKEEWKEVKLEDIAEVIGGGTPKTGNADFWNGDIPWLSVVDFNNGRKYVYTTEKLITEAGLKNSSTKLLEKDDIIISARGTVGIVAVLGKPMAFNQSCYGIRANKLSINDYVYYLLKDQVSNFHQISHGGIFDTITRDTFKEIEITLPPLSQQKAIASVLSGLDNKIDLLHRQNKTLEQMAETLFRQWFVEEAKEDWESKKLEDILDISSSKRIFYKEYVESGIPFYRSKEIIELSQNGSTNSELHITNERFDEVKSKFGAPSEGDILLTSVGTLGVSYRVRKADKFYFKDGNLTWFKDFHGLSSALVYCWLNSSLGKEALDSITIGSTQSALTLSGLRNIELSIPPTKIQAELNLELDAIFKKRNLNLDQIRTLENLRDTLLPKLMSGEVKVSEPMILND